MLWLWTYQNEIGALLVILAIVCSRKDSLPILILAYYALYFMVAKHELDPGGVGAIFSVDDPTFTYFVYTCLGTLIAIASLALYCNSGRKVFLFYTAYLLIYLVIDAAQGILSLTFLGDYTVVIHSTMQQFAVAIDLGFAWLGSDNAVSKYVFSNDRLGRFSTLFSNKGGH